MQILAIYTCAAITVAIMIVPMGIGFLHLQYLPPLLLLPIPAALLLYAYFCFLFNEANSTADGCIFMFAGALLPLVLLGVFQNYTVRVDGQRVETVIDKIDEMHSLPYFNLWKINDIFGDGLNHRNLSFSYDKMDISIIVIWCIISILAAIGFYLAFSRKRTENIGDISSSLVGYRSFIPISMFCIAAYSFQGGEVALCIIGIIAAIIGYMIYRRRMRLKVSDFICIGASVAISIAFSIAFP